MSLINLRLLPKHTFTSIIFPFLKTYHDEMGILKEEIKVGECHFNIKNNMNYDYNISELNKTTRILTKISTNIDDINYDIYEQITIKRYQNINNTYNYTNYSINIVNLKDIPYIHSIKCVGKPLSFDLMNYYTDDIKNFHQIINQKIKID